MSSSSSTSSNSSNASLSPPSEKNSMMSSTASSISTASSMNSLSGLKYSMKTLCFNKKAQCMPSRDEYSVLLSNGLGARKWQVSLDLDAEGLQRAIFNIYPRLATVSGYTLWTITKDKRFEKLPSKVNTPKRISSYLGSHFSGCLIIMPDDTLQMISNESLHSDVCKEDDTETKEDIAANVNGQPSIIRQLCLICGRVAKTVNMPPNAFYNIRKQSITTSDGQIPIFRRLKDILNMDLPKLKLVPSEEICKKCYRQLTEIEYIQTQLSANKEEMISNFMTTVAKVGRANHNLWLNSNNSNIEMRPSSTVTSTNYNIQPTHQSWHVPYTASMSSGTEGDNSSRAMSPDDRSQSSQNNNYYPIDMSTTAGMTRSINVASYSSYSNYQDKTSSTISSSIENDSLQKEINSTATTESVSATALISQQNKEESEVAVDLQSKENNIENEDQTNNETRNSRDEQNHQYGDFHSSENHSRNSTSVSPNSSPSPTNSGGGSSDSSTSSTGSSSQHRHSWKKRYCEMTANSSPREKKIRVISDRSEEDSGITSPEHSTNKSPRSNNPGSHRTYVESLTNSDNTKEENLSLSAAETLARIKMQYS